MQLPKQGSFTMPEATATAAMSLNERGILLATDKSSVANDYLRHYETVFASYRERPINVIEIGVAEGASVKLWSEYFLRAKIIGVDISEHCRQYATDRIDIAIGSQDDPEFLAKLTAKYPPTIIIDDGSHRADHIIFAFERLFPSLLPNGIYVIEDLWLHFDPDTASRYRGNSTMSFGEFASALIGRLMSGRLAPADDVGLPSLFRSIDRIDVIKRALMIRKKPPPPELPGWRAARKLLEQTDDAASWYHLGRLILDGDGPIADAVDAVRRAVTLAPRRADYHHRLSDYLARAGRWDDAVKAGEDAVTASADSAEQPALRQFLEQLRQRQSEASPSP